MPPTFCAHSVFDTSARRTYAVAPPVQNGQLRVVLTWGETPRDLDSHLDTPSGCHVFYGRKQCDGGRESLDTDVTDSYGPETINIHSLVPGVYRCPTLLPRSEPDSSFISITGTRFMPTLLGPLSNPKHQ